MEVGAVKQAFNNEVILLKKNVNQAKVQIIHKLTRKAKTLTEKKAPEHLKEKLKKKAESAVNEVLIIKKIKARDIAKFIITHTGQVKDYLNRPKVDNDKACARLVLHKALQDKYTFIRNRFGNVPIKDLFMSRQERRKLKKEAREQQKNKKKGKNNKVVNAQGDWDVEDVIMGDKSIDDHNVNNNLGSDNEESNDDIENSGRGSIADSESESDAENQVKIQNANDKNQENSPSEQESDNEEDGDQEMEIGKFVKLKPDLEVNELKPMPTPLLIPETGNVTLPKAEILKPKLPLKKQTDKKVKENKNKNLKEKLQNRKFKKDSDESHMEGRKVVDPFFITATGENYLSLAEPREPDEIKEIHKQGNRRERRAALFGHYVPKTKPRNDSYRQNDRANKFQRDGNGADFRNKNDKFNNVNNNNTRFNGRTNFNDKYDNRNNQFNDRMSNKNGNVEKEEKLHPSWEAKKKLSRTVLPFQGKKIVFSES